MKLFTPLTVGATVIFVIVAIAILLYSYGDFTGASSAFFLVLGAFLSIGATFLTERMKKAVQKTELARALYIELADRVARCCFDYEKPWQYLHGEGVSRSGIKKFEPYRPIIFESTARQIAIMGDTATQSIIQFYYRLDSWKREIETCANGNESSGISQSGKRLATRLLSTLQPGLKALTELGAMNGNSAAIESEAIATYDATRPGSPQTKTLRERLRTLIE